MLQWHSSCLRHRPSPLTREEGGEAGGGAVAGRQVSTHHHALVRRLQLAAGVGGGQQDGQVREGGRVGRPEDGRLRKEAKRGQAWAPGGLLRSTQFTHAKRPPTAFCRLQQAPLPAHLKARPLLEHHQLAQPCLHLCGQWGVMGRAARAGRASAASEVLLQPVRRGRLRVTHPRRASAPPSSPVVYPNPVAKFRVAPARNSASGTTSPSQPARHVRAAGRWGWGEPQHRSSEVGAALPCSSSTALPRRNLTRVVGAEPRRGHDCHPRLRLASGGGLGCRLARRRRRQRRQLLGRQGQRQPERPIALNLQAGRHSRQRARRAGDGGGARHCVMGTAGGGSEVSARAAVAAAVAAPRPGCTLSESLGGSCWHAPGSATPGLSSASNRCWRAMGPFRPPNRAAAALEAGAWT